MSERENDLKMLHRVLDSMDGPDPTELREYEQGVKEAFDEMIENMQSGARHQLSDKQRAWVRKEHDKLEPEYEGDLVSSGKVPRRSYGPEVKTLPILDPVKLPKRPPGHS